MFRFIVSRNRFKQIREDYEAPELSHLGCYLILLSEKLSPQGARVLQRAQERYERYNNLLDWLAAEMGRRTKRRKTPISREDSERFQLKAMIDFEFKDRAKNKDWRFESEGIHTLTDDFFLLNQYDIAHRKGMFSSLTKRYGDFLMSAEEKEELENLSEAERDLKKAEKVEPLFFPLFSFFIGLCYALQEDENQLTASDGYWLGLIDEVFGDTSLPSWRAMAEYTPDKPAEPQAVLTGVTDNDGKEENKLEIGTVVGADATAGPKS